MVGILIEKEGGQRDRLKWILLTSSLMVFSMYFSSTMTEELIIAFPTSVIRAMTFKTTMEYHSAVKWLGLHAFTAEAMGLIPDWVTKILQAKWHSRKKKKKRKEMNINSLEWLLCGRIVKN